MEEICKDIKVLYIKITNTCNMNCPFCYEKKGKDVVSIDFVKNICKKFNPNKIVFHGGEPLLFPEKCLEIINLFPNISYSITSNLTLPINNQRLELLKKCSVSTSYSIDRFENNNLFSDFLKNVELISKYKKITLLVTLSRKQLKQNPEELYKTLNKIPCEYINLERLYEEQYDHNLAIDTDLYLKELTRIIPKEKNVLLNDIKRTLMFNTTLYPQNCSTNVLTINANNTLQICPNCGNEKIAKHKNRECLYCDFFEYCRGDCLIFKNGCMFPKETFTYIKNEEF